MVALADLKTIEDWVIVLGRGLCSLNVLEALLSYLSAGASHTPMYYCTVSSW